METYGPFATGSGAGLGQDFWVSDMGVLLQGEGVYGVFGDSSAQVYSTSSGRRAFIRDGTAYARGVAWRNVGDSEVDFAANASGQLRIDRVVLRMDPTAETFLSHVIAGTPGAGLPPAMTQNAGGVWDIPLALVNVASGAAVINPSDITDVRQYLPLRVQPINSQFGYPPADGSHGFMLYDMNPSVRDLVVAVGGTWKRYAPIETDGGYVGISLPFFAGFCRYRIIGHRITWECQVSGGATNPDIGVTSNTLLPVQPLAMFPAYAAVEGSYAPLAEAWAVRMIDEGSAMRIQLFGLDGGTLTGRAFSFNFSYLLS